MFILRADAVCDVCLDPYSEDKSPAVIRCGHVFCRPCLHTLASRSCPICRAYFTPAEITRVHVDFQPASSTPPSVVERPHEEVDLEQQAIVSAKTGDVRQMATVLARLKSWSISMPLGATQPPAIRVVADLLELLMEATTQLSEALEQFSGEERRNTLQSRIREHEWQMEKRELLKERGALREQLELQKGLHTLAEEKLHRVQAAATAASTATTPRRTPSWLPILPPVVSVSTIPITLPELSPKNTGTAPTHEIKVPSTPAVADKEHTESPVSMTSLQPITNLPLPPVSPLEVVSRRRVRPATGDSATRVTNNGTTNSAAVPPVSQAVNLAALSGENPARSRTIIRGPRAPCSATFPPAARNLPVDPMPKTHTGTNTEANTNTARSRTPVAPLRVQTDREAALQTLTSAVALLSSPQRHSVQPSSNQRLWGSHSGSSHPPSSILNLVGAPPRRESLPTVTQRMATLVTSTPQSQSQSQSVTNHVRPPRAQQPSSPPPSFPRRTDMRRSSREIVI